MRSARHTSPCPNPLPRCEALSLNLSNARALFLRQGGGLLIEGGDVQLTNCNIHSNGAFLAGEMVLRGRFSCLWPPPRWPHPLPSPCTCAPVQTEELASGLGGGLSIHGGDVTLTGCNIFSNSASGSFPAVSTPHQPLPKSIAPMRSTFLEPSECERYSSGRAAASPSWTATCSSPTATSTRTRRKYM